MSDYPTEEDFDLVRVLSVDDSDRIDNYNDYLPNEASCYAFAQRMYQERYHKLKKLHSFKAYKWMASQTYWKEILNSLFGTDDLLSMHSEHDYATGFGEIFLNSYLPVTKQEYDRINFQKLKHEQEKNQLCQQYGKGFSIDVSDIHRLSSFEEMNSEENRLHRFRRALSSFHFALMREAFEVSILLKFRDYFYDKDFIQCASIEGPQEFAIEFYQEKMSNIESAYNGLKSLSLYLDKQHSIDDSIGVSEFKIKQREVLLRQLKMIEYDLKNDFDWANEEFSQSVVKIPIIKRKDATSRERVLACYLWAKLTSYTASRPIKAIEYFLQFQGIENAPERRTIERWLKAWTGNYMK